MIEFEHVLNPTTRNQGFKRLSSRSRMASCLFVGPSGSGKSTIVKLITGRSPHGGRRLSERYDLTKIKFSKCHTSPDSRLIFRIPPDEKKSSTKTWLPMRVVGATNRPSRPACPIVLQLVGLDGTRPKAAGALRRRAAARRCRARTGEQSKSDPGRRTHREPGPRQKPGDHDVVGEDQRVGIDRPGGHPRKGPCGQLLQARYRHRQRTGHQRRNGWVLQL